MNKHKNLKMRSKTNEDEFDNTDSLIICEGRVTQRNW